jgi:D-threo-aldose 1-dehydrogenase
VTPGVRTLRLRDTDIETSALGFGCANLFREPSGPRRQRLLAAALDAGICHFDVAPMYGLGLVEGELGRFARGRRDAIVIATKFGIAPSPAARVLARAQGPIQRIFDAVPTLRRRARPPAADPRAGAIGGFLYRARGYDAAAARAGLERSLRELRTDHVDILLLHEPAPGDVRSEDVAGYLESAREAGRIRAWGVSGDPESALDVARGLAWRIPLLQVRGDMFLRSLRSTPELETQATILFGVIARALPRILAHVRSDERLRRRWSDAVGADCGSATVVVSLLLRDALHENAGGPVLFSTLRTDRIETAAKAAMEHVQADPELERFQALVDAELQVPEEQP